MKPWRNLTLDEKTKFAYKHKLTILEAQTRYQRIYYNQLTNNETRSALCI